MLIWISFTAGVVTSRKIPSITSILDAIVPPIPPHELLQVHITHDMIGYPSLEKDIHRVFSTVISTVDAGEFFVYRHGAGFGSSSNVKSKGTYSTQGWSDGEWWYTNDNPETAIRRDLNSVSGVMEARKLAAANGMSFASDFIAANMAALRGRRAGLGSDDTDSSGVVGTNHIFLSIQPVLHRLPTDHGSSGSDTGSDSTDDLISFIVHLHDPAHALTFDTVSQSFPREWIDWFEFVPPVAASPRPGGSPCHPDIAPIVALGGIDPREWAAGWINDAVCGAVEVVARRYLFRRVVSG